MTEATETTPEVSAPQPTAGSKSPTINIVDLQNAVRVIDFAAEQGAFKGWTVIEQVLAVRNKLHEFVTATAPEAAPKTNGAATTVEAQPTAKKGRRKK